MARRSQYQIITLSENPNARTYGTRNRRKVMDYSTYKSNLRIMKKYGFKGSAAEIHARQGYGSIGLNMSRTARLGRALKGGFKRVGARLGHAFRGNQYVKVASSGSRARTARSRARGMRSRGRR